MSRRTSLGVDLTLIRHTVKLFFAKLEALTHHASEGYKSTYITYSKSNNLIRVSTNYTLYKLMWIVH